MPPSVSVCLPTYDRAWYLEQAIESVLGQSFRDFDLLVCDNASNDATPEVVRSFADPRVRYIRNARNLGMTGNWQVALEAATGEFIAILGDDDWWAPTFLERTVEPLRRDPALDVTFTDHWLVDRDGRVLPQESDRSTRRYGRAALHAGPVPSFLDAALRRQALLASASLFRRSRLLEVQALHAAAPNVPAFLIYGKLAMSGGAAYYVPERLTYYRIHPTSATSTIALQTWREFQLACDWLLTEFGNDHPGARMVRESRRRALEHEASLLLRSGGRSAARALYVRLLLARPFRPIGWLGVLATLPLLSFAYRVTRPTRAALRGMLQR